MRAARRNPLRNQVVIAGVGYSPVGKSLGRSELDLALEAGRNALTDAGLRADDVDGLATYPDREAGDTFSGPAIRDIQRGLGLHNLRYWGGNAHNVPAQLSVVAHSAAMIAAGAADVVLCSRTVIAQPRQKIAATRTESLAWLSNAFAGPYGLASGSPKWALAAQRFLYQTGQGPEALAAIVLNNRAMAQLNPRAAWYGSPLTMDDYDNAPMISTPLRILDCDMPIDGSCMVVLASADRAGDFPHKTVHIEAIAQAPGPVLDDHLMDGSVSRYVSQDLWQKTDLTVEDVDVAQIYDGFSYQALQWLEDLGFASTGESGAMVADGHFGLDGKVPICTDGGQLGVGRYHGLDKVAEAALQLWGAAGQRQVQNSQVALACAGAGAGGTAILMTSS
jgi:acetyl-CoA acetyltransferase